MSVQQISIFVENKPGTLNELTRILAEKQINMRALSLAESEGFGIVRIIVDDVLATTSVLKENGYINKLTQVLIVEIPDEPGGLNRVLDHLTKANINLDYMYAIMNSKANATKARMIFKVDDPKAAASVLRANQIRMIESYEIDSL